MNVSELLSLPGKDNPVLCKDGQVGMLLIYPVNHSTTRCGVQVPGEPEHRWIEAAELVAAPQGALRQAGAPRFPNKPSMFDSNYLQQLLLSMDWAQRGGTTLDAWNF